MSISVSDMRIMITRRAFSRSAVTIAMVPLLAACNRKDAPLQNLWTQWQADWRWMEAIAVKRQWEVKPLKIAPPASSLELAKIERRHGLTFPPQLRSVLTELSAHVQFGWHIPSHLQALEREDMPYGSGIRDAIWDLAVIDEHAIPNFLGWKRDLAQRDRSEAPNRPEMWENQFPFGHLPNGDILTIDTSKPEPTRQPVRYFSHDLEMIHGLALAPDFYSFVTVYAKLGCAGSEWASWMRFGKGINDDRDDTFYLSTETNGAKAWLAWLAKDSKVAEPDEPPVTIVEKSPADRALLEAARANSLAAVTAALAGGANIDCVPNDEWVQDTGAWPQEFSTALTYATLHDNIPLLDHLVKRGAIVNTRRLPLGDAVEKSSLATVQWLIANGAQPNGWKHQRFWPLHLLVTRRGKPPGERAAQIKAMTDLGISRADAEKTVPGAITVDDYRVMLEALLTAGADPDAPWDNGITMLMEGGIETAQLLLKYGARIDARDVHGRNAMHWAQSVEKIKLLAARGADVNARTTPPATDRDYAAKTLLHYKLSLARFDGLDLVSALLDLGADPKLKDGAGHNTLAYCTTLDGFKLIQGYGLDPKERLPDGGTLLHNLASMTSVRAAFTEEVAFFKYLLSLGIDINATDDKGQTMLHRMAERVDEPKDIALYLASGADKSIKDETGKRPFNLVPKSLKAVRELLK